MFDAEQQMQFALYAVTMARHANEGFEFFRTTYGAKDTSVSSLKQLVIDALEHNGASNVSDVDQFLLVMVRAAKILSTNRETQEAGRILRDAARSRDRVRSHFKRRDDHLNLRDLSHLRSLADALAVRPDKAVSLLKITLRTANPSKNGPLHRVLKHLQQIEDRLVQHGIAGIANELKSNDDRPIQRAGEILDRALELRRTMPSRRKSTSRRKSIKRS